MTADDVQQRREMAARQRAMAVQMGRAGVAPETIAARTGLSRSAIRRAIARETKEMSAQAEERLALHVDALMELWRALYPAASSGDLASIDRFLQVERRVGDLIGLGRFHEHALVERVAREMDGLDEPRFVRSPPAG